MAWNQRKDSRESKAERRRGGASVRIAALAAVAVLCAAGGVWWWASCGDVVCRPVQPAQSKGPAAIPEAKPAAAPEPAETNAAPQAPRRERLPPGTKRHVTWKRPDNWDQLTRAQKTRIQPVARVIKPVGWDDRKLFSTPSDRRLERLMRVKPGQLVLGTLTYNEKFVSDFLESLKTPIEFEAEDTEGNNGAN